MRNYRYSLRLAIARDNIRGLLEVSSEGLWWRSTQQKRRRDGRSRPNELKPEPLRALGESGGGTQEVTLAPGSTLAERLAKYVGVPLWPLEKPKFGRR